MPAAMLDGPGDVRIERGPDPTPGPVAILVRIHRALARGTDLENDRHPTVGKPIRPAPGREAA